MIFLGSGFLILISVHVIHSATIVLQSKLPPTPLQDPDTWSWAAIDNGKVYIANRNFGSVQETELKLNEDDDNSRIKKERVLETTDFIETAFEVLEDTSGSHLDNTLLRKVKDLEENIELEIELGIDVDADANTLEVIDTGDTKFDNVNELEIYIEHSNDSESKNLTSTVTEYFPASTPLLNDDNPVIISDEEECDRFSCLVVKAYNTVVAQFSK